MGALVAFEIAQQLQRQSEQIALLAIFDSFTTKMNGNSDNVSDAVNLAYLAPRRQSVHDRAGRAAPPCV